MIVHSPGFVLALLLSVLIYIYETKPTFNEVKCCGHVQVISTCELNVEHHITRTETLLQRTLSSNIELGTQYNYSPLHLALNTNHSYVENNSGNCVPVDDKRQHCRLHFGSKLIIVFLQQMTTLFEFKSDHFERT
jgi:hypothetical protein